MKKIFPVIIFSAVILLSGCGQKSVNKIDQTVGTTQEQKNSTQTSQASNTANQEESITSSMKGLMNIGKDMICTYDTDQMNGTVYVSSNGKLIRSEGTSKDGIYVAMIIDVNKDVIYSWFKSKDLPQTIGQKMTFSNFSDTMQNAANQPQVQSQQQQTNMEQQMNYKCKSWSADMSKFTPPSDVDFSDMSDFYKNLNINK